MKFWITNAGGEFRFMPRLRVTRERLCFQWIGVVFSLKWKLS